MGVGLHIAELPTLGTAPGRKLVFTNRGQTDDALGGRAEYRDASDCAVSVDRG